MFLSKERRPIDSYPDPFELDTLNPRVLHAYEATKRVHLAVITGKYASEELEGHRRMLEKWFGDAGVAREIVLLAYRGVVFEAQVGKLNQSPPEMQVLQSATQALHSTVLLLTREDITRQLLTPYYG